MALLGLLVLLFGGAAAAAAHPHGRRSDAARRARRRRARRRAAAVAALPRRGVNVTGTGAGSITAPAGRTSRSSAATRRSTSPNRTSAMIDIAQVQGQVHAQSVQKVGELADKNPNETVAIIRTWLHENAA